MSTIDDIMHGGEYIDLRGRRWCNLVELKWDADAAVTRTTKIGWCRMRGLTKYDPPIAEAQMRLLIERDLHRATCPGLWTCENHPVPTVTLSRMFKPRIYVDDFGALITLAQAMDAARDMAVRDV